jgi:hypothetical protein
VHVSRKYPGNIPMSSKITVTYFIHVGQISDLPEALLQSAFHR